MKKFFGKKYLIIATVAILLLFSIRFHSIFEGGAISAQANASVASNKSLPIFTADQLKKYNGNDPSLPIYLVLDGYVYDITKGKEFYVPGAPYHYLAGRDSSVELHMVGGDIIKRKYPIVGRLENIN